MRCPIQSPPRNGFAFETQTKYGSSYKFGCDKGFSLPPNYPSQSFCVDGDWVPEIPQSCMSGQTCAPIVGTNQVLSNCQTNGLEKQCSEAVDVGSKVTTTCKKAYRTPSPIEHTCQSNGEWWPPVNKCTAICGRTPSVPHIPWHVAVYRRTQDDDTYVLPSGVIVSERVVLTNAKRNFYQTPDDVSLLWVKAGEIGDPGCEKSTRVCPIDPNAQRRGVAERFLIPNPIDVSDPSFAVIIVDKPFHFNINYVSPVCLDFSNSFSSTNNEALVGQTGSVFSFDFTQIVEDVYKIIDDSECKSNYSNNKEFTRGNLCARRPSSGHICAGVVGAGFVIPKIEDDETVHYLKGIGRKGPGDVSPTICAKFNDEYQYFINVNVYKDEIQKYIANYS